MTMKDSEDARKMEDLTDKMIISLLEEMRSLTVQNKGVRREVTQSTSDTSAKPSEVDEMDSVLKLYDDIIEQLWKIADNIATTSAAEEQHAGTVFMGSSGDGTYLPEISDEFDVYVMEEDSQYELQENLEAMDADFASKNPDNTHLLEVLPTKKPGYFFLTWSNYGLELKQRYHEKLASQQAYRGGASEVGTEPRPVPIFKKLINFTEEIEYEGRKIQVISPHKIRLHQLANPPTSIQAFIGNGGSPNIRAEWVNLRLNIGGMSREQKKEPGNWIFYKATEKERQTFAFILTFYTKTGDF